MTTPFHTTSPHEAEAVRPAWRDHMPALDGLRGLAVLSVMLFHMTFLPPSEGIAKLLEAGWVGVDLFFALSGFLITGILLDTKGRPYALRNFWLRRALRILPLYYALVVACLIVLPLFHHPKLANFSRINGDEIYYWFFLSNVPIALSGAFRHGVLDVTWSLAIEQQFYLFWPLLVFTLNRRPLLILAVLIMLFSVAGRYTLLSFDLSATALYVLTITRMEPLAAGAIVALLLREGRLSNLMQRVAAAHFVALGMLGLVLVWVIAGGFRWDNPVVMSVGYPIVALVAAGLVLIAARAAGETSGWLQSAVLVTLGRYSYAMYLFHLPVRAAIRDMSMPVASWTNFPGGIITAQLVFYIVSISSTLLIAVVSYHLFEKHFLRLKVKVA